jgi:hypothetical protein
MTNEQQTAIRQQYELDPAGQLWTRPRGSRVIVQARIIYKMEGLTYAIATDIVRDLLAPAPKRKKCRECKSVNHKMSCTKGRL